MPQRHPNADLLDLLYSGQRDAFFRHLAPDYVMHTPGHGLGSGEFRGPEGHAVNGQALRELTGGTFKVRALGSLLADDRWGFVPSRITAQRNGRELDTYGFGIWRFQDGQAAEHWTLPSDYEAFQRFFS